MSKYQVTEGVAVITLDRPPVNALGLPLRRHLADALYAAQEDVEVRAVVISGAGRCFSGGGDITEFDQPTCDQEPAPRALFDRVEASTKPVVAALHGMALGGGLELALACHARVTHQATQVGLPEVHLGLVPGAGGTQRLPRLIGFEMALDLIVSGRTQTAESLRDSGLFDLVTDGDVLREATSLARQMATSLAAGEALPRTGDRSCRMDNAQAFTAYVRGTLKSPAGSSPAPKACVDCVEAAVLLPFEQGLDRESETFRQLRASPQFSGLRHTFLAERAASNIVDVPAGTQARRLERAAVIGGGTMGTGIAMALANAGLRVVLLERDQAAVDRALHSIRDHYESSAKRGKLSPENASARIALVSGSLEYEAVADCDLAIEAVFEDMAIKRQVFERLDAVAKPGAILATNTSMLDVNHIAAFTRRPADVLGLHFFSPAHVMKLLEIVQGDQTAPDVIASAIALARKIGKTAVVSRVCEGFIGNRMLEAYMMQAGLLLDEGALPQQVDRAMERWGMAMGPFRVNDMAGNDLAAKIRATRIKRDPSLVYSGTFDAVVRQERLGQKVGRGWYDYPPGQRMPAVSREVQEAVIAHSQHLGLQRRNIGDDEIVDRLLLALANEGCKILEEGIAQRASDIDVVYTAGYGFPRWRGGPMFAAEQRGLADVLAVMQRFAKGPAYQRPEHFWRPAALLSRLAANGGSLFKLNESETA